MSETVSGTKFFSIESSPTNWALNKAAILQSNKKGCAARGMVTVATLTAVPSALKNLACLIVKIFVNTFALTFGQIPSLKARIWKPLETQGLVGANAGRTLLNLVLHVYKCVMFLTFSPLCCLFVGTFYPPACKIAHDALGLTSSPKKQNNNNKAPQKPNGKTPETPEGKNKPGNVKNPAAPNNPAKPDPGVSKPAVPTNKKPEKTPTVEVPVTKTEEKPESPMAPIEPITKPDATPVEVEKRQQEDEPSITDEEEVEEGEYVEEGTEYVEEEGVDVPNAPPPPPPQEWEIPTPSENTRLKTKGTPPNISSAQILNFGKSSLRRVEKTHEEPKDKLSTIGRSFLNSSAYQNALKNAKNRKSFEEGDDWEDEDVEEDQNPPKVPPQPSPTPTPATTPPNATTPTEPTKPKPVLKEEKKEVTLLKDLIYKNRQLLNAGTIASKNGAANMRSIKGGDRGALLRQQLEKQTSLRKAKATVYVSVTELKERLPESEIRALLGPEDYNTYIEEAQQIREDLEEFLPEEEKKIKECLEKAANSNIFKVAQKRLPIPEYNQDPEIKANSDQQKPDEETTSYNEKPQADPKKIENVSEEKKEEAPKLTKEQKKKLKLKKKLKQEREAAELLKQQQEDVKEENIDNPQVVENQETSIGGSLTRKKGRERAESIGFTIKKKTDSTN